MNVSEAGKTKTPLLIPKKHQWLGLSIQTEKSGGFLVHFPGDLWNISWKLDGKIWGNPEVWDMTFGEFLYIKRCHGRQPMPWPWVPWASAKLSRWESVGLGK